MTHQRYSKELVLLGLGLAIASCTTTRIEHCPPDNRPVSMPVSATAATKLYANAVKTFNANLKATVNIIDKVTIGIDDARVKTDAQLLRVKLDQESSRYQEALKASYLGMSVDPCLNSAHHAKLIESLTTKDFELQTLKAELESKRQLGTATLDSTFHGYLYQRGKREGTAMSKLIKALDAHYALNNKYPEDLAPLVNISDELKLLGIGRLDYKRLSDGEISLKFAGADYILGTPDDKTYKGLNGSTTRI
jgi:hypothetical protein